MSSKSSKNKVESWWKSLDQALVREALDEAIVDAYGQSEEHTGLLSVIQDELCFPFRASVAGEELEIVGMQWPNGDSYGLDLVCQRNKKQYPIEARSVELCQPLPDGHLFLAAYLAWQEGG